MSRAVVLEHPGELRLDERDVPEPGVDEVLVRIEWAGICGSDVDLRDGRRPPGFAEYPVVPGHEWSGNVVAAGADVDDGLVGTPVVAEGIRPCGLCTPCRAREAQRCETAYDETGFTRDGAWAEHLVVPAALVHGLPRDSDLRAAAGIEPAACAAAIVERVEMVAGERVAVIGGGTIGLLTAQLLRGARPSELIVVEPNPARWELAEWCGATQVMSAAPSMDASFDVVVEAAGALGTAQEAVRLARRGGRVVVAGTPPAADVVLTQEVVAKQLDLRTVFGAPSRSWDLAVRAFSDGTLDPGVLITHELPLEEAGRALDLVAEHEAGVGKVLLRP